ncbi:hypothetical protein B0H14DRAFT_3755568 [Mycena olivaceomarginata]|nr:hypothetical protein B0H14DRAFT_3755568 [Mycena olivaceomarginata]
MPVYKRLTFDAPRKVQTSSSSTLGQGRRCVKPNTRCRCPTHISASGIRRPPHALLPFQPLRDPAPPYDCARATLTGPDYQLDSIRIAPTSMSITTHTVPPASSFCPAILSSPPSHSPSLAVLCSSLPFTDSSRSPLPIQRRPSIPALVPRNHASSALTRDPRLACRRVGRVCWYGAMSGAVRALRIVQAHMSTSSTATSSSTSLPFPLLSFFPPPVFLDRFAVAPLPMHCRSSSFGALSLVLAPARCQPTAQTSDPIHQRWQASVCVGAGAALFPEPGSASTMYTLGWQRTGAIPALHTRCSPSASALVPRCFGTHTLISYPFPPRPLPPSVSHPSPHTTPDSTLRPRALAFPSLPLGPIHHLLTPAPTTAFSSRALSPYIPT